MSDTTDEMESLSGEYENHLDREESKPNEWIKIIAKAILEQQERGQLCPQIIKQLKEMI